MIPPPIPPDEAARIEELKNLSILDTPAEERFDRLTRLAVKLFNVPIAMVSLVDSGRQWFKSCQGLAVSETPRSISFCGHAILSPDPLVITDAHLDPRFQDNPLVTGEPFVRFYAGVPLTGPQGHRLGVFCVIDRKPREFGAEDMKALKDLAALAQEELNVAQITQVHQRLLKERDDLRSQALVDSLTRLWNRAAILEILELELKRASQSRSCVGVAMADLDHFKGINDTYGHPVGDVALLETARRIRSSLRPTDTAGRIGGEEFLVVLPGIELPEALDVTERIRSSMTKDNIITPRGILSITLSLGVGVTPKDKVLSPASILTQIDKALYEAKNAGRNCVRQCVLE
jgi:diguanylate cyclase (GGDEF)-like protein